MQSAITKVRTRGASGSGLDHWMAQRITAVANLLLVLWFVFVAVGMAGAGHAEWAAWMQSPINASLMILLVISTFYHAKLGVQVVFEDYVHVEGVRVAALLAIRFVAALLATVCIVSILTLATGG